MKSKYDDIKLNKEIKRKEYHLIRNSNSSLIHEKIKCSVKSALKILLEIVMVKTDKDPHIATSDKIVVNPSIKTGLFNFKKLKPLNIDFLIF